MSLGYACSVSSSEPWKSSSGKALSGHRDLHALREKKPSLFSQPLPVRRCRVATRYAGILQPEQCALSSNRLAWKTLLDSVELRAISSRLRAVVVEQEGSQADG